MPTYKLQKGTAYPYSSLQRSLHPEMTQELSTMNTSVYDFDEDDPKPFLHTKLEIFSNFFNHGGIPYGKQEKCGKLVVSTSKKKQKLTAKKLPKKKSRRRNTALKAISNRSSSASDLIEATDSDSDSKQERKKLEMRFGGASEIACLNTFREEDYVAEQSREVVICGNELVFLEQCYSFPVFIFTTDGIVLKIGSTAKGVIVKWALYEIELFRSRFYKEEGLAFIKLGITELGVRTFLQALGQSISGSSCQALLSSLSSDSSSWEDTIKKITSLSDGYRSIWEPMKEDVKELFQESTDSITRQRLSLEKQQLVECLACDRDRAASDNWFDLIFPTKEDHDAVTVTQYDFLLLNPDQFLSDTIIDFYIKYLQTELSDEQNMRFYFYNSFFFRKLTEVDRNIQHGLDKKKSSFERVKRWTAKINIFEKDYLIIPIMQSAHWSLVIVCHPGSLSAGCQDACDSKAPMILHFDSLEGCHTFVEEPIRKYLMEAWNEKNGCNEDPENLSILKFVAVKAPQQTNYSDCGIFLLHYVELFVKEVLEKDSIDFVFDEWFNPQEISSKRSEIQSLIQSLKVKELKENPVKVWFHTPSDITGPFDGCCSAERPDLVGEEYANASNLLSGNMLDQGCSMHTSQVFACTKLGHDYLESGLDIKESLATRELQDCVCHSQRHAPDGQLSMHFLLEQGAVNHVQDICMPICTCGEENCAVHDCCRTSLHETLEGTSYNENFEDLHALNSDVVINTPGEYIEGLDNGVSGFAIVEEDCIAMKSDLIENIGADGRILYGFSLHYDSKTVSDMPTSTVQNFLDERLDVQALRKGSESPKDGKHYIDDHSLIDQVTISNTEPGESFLRDLEPKIWLTELTGYVNDLEDKEIQSTPNKCVEDGLMQSEDEINGGDTTPKESLTECAKPLELSDNSSPLLGEGTELDRPQNISSDEGLTPNATEGSKERKRGRARRRSNLHQLTPATKRVTRSASKRR